MAFLDFERLLPNRTKNIATPAACKSVTKLTVRKLNVTMSGSDNMWSVYWQFHESADLAVSLPTPNCFSTTVSEGAISSACSSSPVILPTYEFGEFLCPQPYEVMT